MDVPARPQGGWMNSHPRISLTEAWQQQQEKLKTGKPPVVRRRRPIMREHPNYIKKWLAEYPPHPVEERVEERVEQRVEEYLEEQFVQQAVEQRGEQRVEESLQEQFVQQSIEQRDEERVEEYPDEQFIQQSVEQRDEPQTNGWENTSEWPSDLTTSPTLKIRYIQEDAQREVLRRLSRVLSQSPAPSPVVRDIESPTSPEKDVFFEEADFTFEEADIQYPVPTPAVREIPAPKSPEKEMAFDEAEVQNPTPSPTVRESESPEQRPEVQKPAPKPAVAAIQLPKSPDKAIAFEEAKVQTPTPHTEPLPVKMTTSRVEEMSLEDSTLDAFESFQEQAPITIPTTFEQYFAMQVAERERLIDEAVRARMNNRLNQTKDGIRDAKRGIGRLDEYISSMPSAPAISSPTQVAQTISVTKSTDESTSNDTLIEYEVKFDHRLKIKRPQWCHFWTANTAPQKRGRIASFGTGRNWKFTWLGLILAIFSAWYLAESFVCGLYCHPTTSSTNSWQPSDPFFPWAIPTKLDQWTGEVVSTTVHLMRDNFDHFLDPEGLRHMKRIHRKNARMGANDWWQGRSGPVGYRPRERDVGIESDYELYD